MKETWVSGALLIGGILLTVWRRRIYKRAPLGVEDSAEPRE